MPSEGNFGMQVWVSYDNDNIMNKVHLRRVIFPQLLVQQQDISSLPWLAAAMWFIIYLETSSSHSCRVETEPGHGVFIQLHPLFHLP